ncbi:substrate-binding domain-containing protein [Streptomyces sp. B21-083]|uniref:substrate-binding domain-containing protein n=1 Tax=Streptomyces sp. B21-083 TaxID=3039410 RepID=UPI002FF18552
MPGDVSLVGYDVIPEAEYVWPPLTTVRQDFGEAGRRARRNSLSPRFRASREQEPWSRCSRTDCAGQQRPSSLTAESEPADLPGRPARPSRGRDPTHAAQAGDHRRWYGTVR